MAYEAGMNMQQGFVHSGLGRSTGAPSAFRQSTAYGGVSFHRADAYPHFTHASRGRARSHQPPAGYFCNVLILF